MNKDEQKPRLKDMVIYCVKCDCRMQLEPEQRQAQCPECGSIWGVRWLAPDLPLPERRIMTNT